MQMSGSMNKVILIGNVGRDPELRRTSTGEAVVNLSVATGETWKDKTTGEKRERTEWHRVVIYNEHIADFVEKYVRKGLKVAIEGQLQTKKFTDKAGIERTQTDIVLQKHKGTFELLEPPMKEQKPQDQIESVPFMRRRQA